MAGTLGTLDAQTWLRQTSVRSKCVCQSDVCCDRSGPCRWLNGSWKPEFRLQNTTRVSLSLLLHQTRGLAEEDMEASFIDRVFLRERDSVYARHRKTYVTLFFTNMASLLARPPPLQEYIRLRPSRLAQKKRWARTSARCTDRLVESFCGSLRFAMICFML